MFHVHFNLEDGSSMFPKCWFQILIEDNSISKSSSHYGFFFGWQSFNLHFNPTISMINFNVMQTEIPKMHFRCIAANKSSACSQVKHLVCFLYSAVLYSHLSQFFFREFMKEINILFNYDTSLIYLLKGFLESKFYFILFI